MSKGLFFWIAIVLLIFGIATLLNQRYGFIESISNLSPPAKNLQTGKDSFVQGSASFDKITECKAPIYLSDTFPPSPITLPPLPPSRGPYEEPTHICRHFAFEFCQDLKKLHKNVLCSVLFFDTHAINFVIYTDEKGKMWLCFVEPQTNEYTCIEPTPDLIPWIQDTLCREYYKWPPEECKESVLILPLCEDVEGSTCTRDQVGESKRCLTGGGGGKDVNNLVCKCTYNPYEVCSWQFPVSTGTTAVRSSNP